MKAKCDWLISGRVTFDKCNVSHRMYLYIHIYINKTAAQLATYYSNYVFSSFIGFQLKNLKEKKNAVQATGNTTETL